MFEIMVKKKNENKASKVQVITESPKIVLYVIIN